jgi:hypothetical protein
VSQNRPDAVWLQNLAQAPALVETGADNPSVEFLLSLIRETLVAHPRQSVRIASVGCSEGREVAIALERWPEVGPRLDVAVLGTFANGDDVSRRSLTRLAGNAGATLRFLLVDESRPVDAGELSASIGARDLIYCDGQSQPGGESLLSLLPHLHGRLSPGGLLVLLNATANDESGADLVAWARSVPGNSVEVRQMPFGPLAFLAIRR